MVWLHLPHQGAGCGCRDPGPLQPRLFTLNTLPAALQAYLDLELVSPEEASLKALEQGTERPGLRKAHTGLEVLGATRPELIVGICIAQVCIKTAQAEGL